MHWRTEIFFSLLPLVLCEPYLQNVREYNPPREQQQTHQQQCNVPPDFWCDSYEIAWRCNQCESFKNDPRPLKITLMYEALCPYCQRFIANNLGNLHSRFGNRTQLDLVPWGNGLLLRNGQISCNHGPKECDANRMMSCVIDEVPNSQAIPFIICFERSLSANSPVEQAMHHCSGFIRDKYRQIKQCYVGERGLQLQRQAAQRTMSAKANPIVEVPYLLVNDYAPNTDANAINILSLYHLIQKWMNWRGAY